MTFFMKRYCVIAALIILTGTIVSCTSSSKDHPRLQISKALQGTWELRGITGGMAIPEPNNYKPGNGNTWRFAGTHFERMLHDSVYDSGSYTIADTGVDMNTGRRINQFIFNGTPAESFEIRNDTLHIYYGEIAADGVISHYVKVADVN
jgi:hypothetical protein